MNSSSTPPPTQAPKRTPQWVQDITPLAMFILAGLVMAFFYPVFALKAVIFIAVLGVLVCVHEWGHYQFALWGGMKVNRFGIGFPPWIFNIRRNNIDYSIGALPIGGMVDIAGLGSEEEMVHTASGKEVPRNARNPDTPHGQKNFQDASLFWRFMSLFAGPMMNFVLAIVIFIGVYSIAGRPVATNLARVESVMDGTPAAKAGLQAGDVIVAVGSKRTVEREDVAKIIQSGKLEPMVLTVKRDNKEIKKSVTPVMKDLGAGIKPSIGVAFDINAFSKFEYVKVKPLDAVKMGVMESVGVSIQILDFLRRAITFNLTPQEVRQVGGPVKIAVATGDATDFGLTTVIRFAAVLSMNLGLMNLLPFPALDGGRILFLGYELVMRRPVNPRIEGVVHMAGMIMLLTFMVLITIRDVANLPGVAALKKMFG